MSEKKILKIKRDFSRIKETLKIHGFLRHLVKTKNILHTQMFANYKLPIDDLSKYQWDKENYINDLSGGP